MSPPEREIQKAHPRARRQAAMIVASLAVVGLVLVVAAEPLLLRFERWITADPTELEARLGLAFGAFTLMLAAPPLAFAAYLWRHGARVVGTGRFPPPDMALARDTPVLHGDDARRRGRLIQILAVLLVVAVVFLVSIVWRLSTLLDSVTA